MDNQPLQPSLSGGMVDIIKNNKSNELLLNRPHSTDSKEFIPEVGGGGQRQTVCHVDLDKVLSGTTGIPTWR